MSVAAELNETVCAVPEIARSTLLSSHSSLLKSWLFDAALPTWWAHGADHERGGFHESLNLDGSPTNASRRARVQPRQAYCYAHAGRLGWSGPWEAAARHGLDYFESTFAQDTGFFAALATHEGNLLDTNFSLYNHAFAIFAYAQMATAFPHENELHASKAVQLLHRLKRNFAHPNLGFEESSPRSLPLCSNPHMHLFEAALAWSATKTSCAPEFSALANEIGELCLTRFVDAETGALREFFDADWQQHPSDIGRTVEPGHQFEWAWLLSHWGHKFHRGEALRAARRLFEIGESHGICKKRNVAVMALNDDFSVRDGTARLWPQTEWLKASLSLATFSSGKQRDSYLQSALNAVIALRAFLDVPFEGLWRDKLLADGSFIEEPATASSFYHIVCAIAELDAVTADLTMAS
ncbi:AGE family epimerase/isomerase [Roseibium sp.]|uniref:AGE family epimerase/isomerase n=1 Tax=Roseibium sp. TaxID=1936156 RepID=UPI003A984895